MLAENLKDVEEKPGSMSKERTIEGGSYPGCRQQDETCENAAESLRSGNPCVR